MSGHSKWTQIKRQKGVADVKRGQAFTRISSMITIAVRDGGGISDPEQNFKLRLAVEKAREANMPKDTIERAIEKGKGKNGSDSFEEVVYEGFTPGGVAIIVEAATDKKIRTTGEIKNVFDKSGGTLGQPGSVAYQFRQMGKLVVKKNGKSFDDILLAAADAGAEDGEEGDENEVAIYTQVSDLMKVKEALLAQGMEVTAFELVRKSTVPNSLEPSEEVMQKVADFIEKLESMDDVQKVYVNL